MNSDDLRPAYEGPDSWLGYVGIARIGVLSFVIVGVALIWLTQGGEGPNYFLVLLFAFALGTSIWYLHRFYREGTPGPQQNRAQILVDFGVVAITVAVSGGPASFFTFLFVIVVLESVLLLGLFQGFLISGLASGFMLFQLFDSADEGLYANPFESWYNFLVQCLAFFLTAFISGYWNQRLKRIQSFQRDILDNMSSGFLITDGNGVVMSQNRAAGTILGIADDYAVGRAVEDVLPAELGGECPVLTVLRSGKDFTSYEFRAPGNAAGPRLLGLTTNQVWAKDGSLTGIIVSFTDLTEMDQLRQEMRKQDRLAVVGELAAGLAHEIRNPVAVIRGAVEELQNGRPHSETQSKLRSIALRESDHLNDIVGGFLDFAREPEVKREVFDLRDLALEVRELVDLEYSEMDGYATRLECPVDSCWVSADVSQLKQVLVNLARNAMEAMKPGGGGTLRINLSRHDAGPIELRFDDEGPGVPPDEVARIFEPFYTTKESGVGMGLAVCARIVTAHDGTIRASSREGGGCSMIVHLPAAQPEEE